MKPSHIVPSTILPISSSRSLELSAAVAACWRSLPCLLVLAIHGGCTTTTDSSADSLSGGGLSSPGASSDETNSTGTDSTGTGSTGTDTTDADTDREHK